MYEPAHRREPVPTAPRRPAPLVLLIALVALLLPVSATLATPGGKPGPNAAAAGKTAKPKPKKEPVWTGTPGTNAAHDSYGYAWPAAPDCDESNVASGGCLNDGVGFFQGQCTSWVAHRLAQRNGIAFTNWYRGRHWGNASQWSKVAKGLDYVSDKKPSIGAVGWYARGHVSYIEDVNADGSLVISEMNTDGHNGFVVHTVYPGERSWPDRFLHLGPATDAVAVDTTPPSPPAAVSASAVDATVEVSWDAASDDVGVAGYRVLRNGMPLAETETASYVDRQASPGQAYTYSVVARDGAGNASAPGTTVLGQAVPPVRKHQRGFVRGSATVIAAGDSTAVCGRVGSDRRPHVACRLRTLGGWTMVRTGRDIAWGVPGSRIFLPGTDGTIWYCRVLPGSPAAEACLPLDVVKQSWGFDRVGPRRAQPAYATWVPTAAAPVRCGMLGERAVCSVLTERGWRTRATAPAVRPGDRLSRAFVATGDGVAFCRTVQGRANCLGLDARRLSWGGATSSRALLPHGRWVSRPAGPVLCLPAAGCRTLRPTKG